MQLICWNLNFRPIWSPDGGMYTVWRLRPSYEGIWMRLTHDSLGRRHKANGKGNDWNSLYSFLKQFPHSQNFLPRFLSKLSRINPWCCNYFFFRFPQIDFQFHEHFLHPTFPHHQNYSSTLIYVTSCTPFQ